MKNAISFDKVLQNIKMQSEEAALTIEAAEKTVNIINKIVESRKALGMTQRDLAKKCGIRQPTLARIETCQEIPKLNTCIKIADAVGLKISLTSLEEEQMKFISKVVLTQLSYNTAAGGIYGYKNYKF